MKTPHISFSIWHYLKNALALTLVGFVVTYLVKKVFKGEGSEEISGAITQAVTASMTNQS